MAGILGLYDEVIQVEPWSYGNAEGDRVWSSYKRKWYYPGYTLDLPSTFEYKLKLGDMEYYTRKSIGFI